MNMLRQLITFETYFYKQVSPVPPEEFRILGWALEKAGQPVRIQNSVISSGEGRTVLAGPYFSSADHRVQAFFFLRLWTMVSLQKSTVGPWIPSHSRENRKPWKHPSLSASLCGSSQSRYHLLAQKRETTPNCHLYVPKGAGLIYPRCKSHAAPKLRMEVTDANWLQNTPIWDQAEALWRSSWGVLPVF